MKKKLGVFAATVAATAMCFTGCGDMGSARNRDNGFERLASRSGSLTIWWPSSEDKELPTIRQAAADYKALYPDVTVNIIGQSGKKMYEMYLNACSANTAPDIAYIDSVYVPFLAHYKHIGNLSSAEYAVQATGDEQAPEYKKFDTLSDKFVPSLWQSSFYDGKLFGLPMSANVLVTMYNKTLIARAQNTATDNIALPTDYASLVELCEQIAALNDGKYGMALPCSDMQASVVSFACMQYLAYFARCGGSNVLSSDFRTSGFNSDAAKETAKKFYALGAYAPPAGTVGDFEGQFQDGNVAFMEMGPWLMNTVEAFAANAVTPWEVGYTTCLPFTANGKKTSTVGLFNLVVTNQDNKQKMALAADFAKFVATTDKYQLKFARDNSNLPCTVSAVADDYYKSDKWQVFMNQLSDIAIRPLTPVWSDIEDPLGKFVIKLVKREPRNESDVLSRCASFNGTIQSKINEFFDEE